MTRASIAVEPGQWLRRRMLTEPRRPASIRSSPSAPWYVVGTVCIGAFMGQLDASIVTLALPRLARDLHATTAAVEWVALTYLLVLVASVAVVGRIADAVGRKLIYVYGFGVFTAGSVACGLAPNLPVLIGARAFQALGAAMIQANSVALVTEALPRRLLGKGIGVQGAAQALGLALGPAIGGLLLALGGWRLIFLVNVPAGAAGLVLGWFLLPRSRSRRPIDRADRWGAALLTIAAGGPLIYLSLATRLGYSDPVLLLALGAGVFGAIAFVRRERRIDAPLIDLSVFRRPALSTGLSAGLVSYLVLFGALVVIPYFLLSGPDSSPALVGLKLSALPLAIAVAAPIAGRLVNRVDARLLTGGGLMLAAAGLGEIAVSHDGIGLIMGLALAGVGLGAFTPANNAAIMVASPAGHTGTVGGVLNMTRGLGTALGVALTTALYTAVANAGQTSIGHGSLAANARGLTGALAALALLAAATGVTLIRRPDPRLVGSAQAEPTPASPPRRQHYGDRVECPSGARKRAAAPTQ